MLQVRLKQNPNKYLTNDLACKFFGLASLSVVIMAVLMPRSMAFNGPYICLFNHILNYPCPSCGLTRSVYSFFHGDISEAFAFNPVGPFLSVLFIIWSFDIYFNNSSFWNKFLRSTQTSVVIVLVGIWVFEFVGYTIR